MAIMYEDLFSGESTFSPEVATKEVPLKCITKMDLVSITAMELDKPITQNRDTVQQYFERVLEKN